MRVEKVNESEPTEDASNVQGDAGYTVISDSASMSAFVQVTGYWMVNPFDYSQAWWTVNGAAMLDTNGAALSTDVPTAQAQMSVIDVGLFGFGRNNNPKVANVSVSSAYASSFINSIDEEVGPGIGAALIAKGTTPAAFAVGSKILVTFSDGTKAVFVKISMVGSDQWSWDGLHAWDAQGRPIGRSGSQISNPNSSGAGTGSASFSQTLSDANGLWFMFQNQHCETSTAIRINGVLVSTFFGYVPC